MKRMLIICALLPLLAACDKSDEPITIGEVRDTGGSGGPQPTGMSTAQRLGVGGAMQGTPGMGAAPAASGFTFEIPEGWSELPTTQFREVNLRVAGNEGADCYVSRAGGGVEANVNRWRGQMGLEPLDAAAITALPRKPFLGGEAVFTDFEGTYTGMGQEPQDNYRMVGLMQPIDGQAVFVKMTGPADVIAQELEHFDAFIASLSTGGATAAAGSDPHAGMSMAGAGGHSGTPDLHWTAPEGWSEIASTSSMRMVTFQVDGAECSVTRLPGEAGGIAANIGMWYGQMGQEPPAEAEIATLEQIDMMGAKATFVRITGDFQDHSMSGQSGEGFAMLGVVCPQPDSMLFVKFIGPESVVAAQEAAFRAFLASLHDAQH
jgi:hypothetical protein